MTTSPRLVYTPSPGYPYPRFNAGTEVVYAEAFSPPPAMYEIVWVRGSGGVGAVLVSAADLSVVA